jgi:uncharacterized protein YndB with AHSA1/START domain
MGPASAEIEVDVPREQAFAALTDMARRPSFTDHFLTGFHLTRIDPVGVGAGARFRIKAPLRSVWMDSAIVEAAAPHKIVEKGSGGRANRIPNRIVWEVTERAGGLSHIHVSHWTEPSNPVDKLLETVSGNSVALERGWRQALRRLRDQLESERPGGERVTLAGGNRYATGIP